ncbi:MAG: Stk1 family PASTA domain-containing Ser/Thr kinase [Clostridia bacterium]|nr:Stk1 family PASTA domain-containing Ser/Thr kinase [Clostridia bacterium]
MDLIGKVLGNRYEIIEQIGIGGMAVVYKAKCNLLNRFVAVKVLKSEFSKDETFVKRFRAEAQSAASLTHPNIVSVYDVGKEGEINYIVMELLESKTLKDYIDEHGALDNETVLKISAQIASALEAAHKSHIIHRDIKPHNIVLNKNMVAKVTDFGIAKVTTSATITNFGSTIGSVHYFSPEHAKGGYTDEKSDIYSLGVVMYEMATGKLPFDADSPVSVALKHIQEDPIEPIKVNPNISKTLNDIIIKAMAKNTANRYKNSTEMLDDIYFALKDPNKLILKSNSKVEAGATQVIPIVSMKEAELNKVPNIRIRAQRRPQFEERKASKTNEIVEEKNILNDDNEKDIVEEINNKKKNKSITMIIIILAAVIFISIVVIYGFKIYKKITGDNVQVQSIIVPDLVGRKFSDVVEEYLRQGIEVLQDKQEYNATQPEGYVISQNIAKGTSTTDKKIYVVVSKGQKIVTVPDVTGKDYKVAKYELEETLGFVTEQELVTSDSVAEGIIISQDPKKDEQKPYGSTIKLKVSQGDGKVKVIMPSVLGKTEADAKKTLTDLKLNVNVKYGEDKTKSNATVIAQSYPQNQELKEGTLVEITVNKLIISKTITLDLTALKASLQNNTTEETDEGTIKNIVVKVTASVDSGAINTVYERTHKSTDTTATLTINGYSKATLAIYIDNVKVKDQIIDFTT